MSQLPTKVQQAMGIGSLVKGLGDIFFTQGDFQNIKDTAPDQKT